MKDLRKVLSLTIVAILLSVAIVQAQQVSRPRQERQADVTYLE